MKLLIRLNSPVGRIIKSVIFFIIMIVTLVFLFPLKNIKIDLFLAFGILVSLLNIINGIKKRLNMSGREILKSIKEDGLSEFIDDIRYSSDEKEQRNDFFDFSDIDVTKDDEDLS